MEAVESAREIQDDLEGRNAKLSSERRMLFRIGISQGDVVVKDSAIYGDDVNIAARLEALADPGGICISSAAHANVVGKLEITCEFLGEHQLKNISNPVPVYRVLFGPGAASSPGAIPTASRLNKPSIAVLPFANFSADQEQEYFADGITEDIITELSRFKSLLVIARNSTFAYKGQAVTVPQVARDLGVQYVLEGSVRKAGNRVRITAQLIEATDGSHLWAERYDRELADVFAVQDEIAQMIVAALPRRLESANLERVNLKTTENLVAYDYLLRGKDHHHRRTREDNALALKMLDKAIELDPHFALAYAWKACTLGQAAARGYREWNEELSQESLTLAEKSRDLDEDESECHRILCELHLFQLRFDQAEIHHERALSLNPNDPRIVAQRGQLMTWLGQADEGVAWIELARRLDPYPPDARADSLGQALIAARRYAEAIKAYKLIANLNHTHHAHMAACHAMLGDMEAAHAHADTVRKLAPDYTVDGIVNSLPYKHDQDREHHREALRKAGLS